jgi:hypothetical protein
MNDTPENIRQKQHEIVSARTMDEKLKGLFEMTDLSRRIIEGRIRSKKPDISEIELKIETFKTFYRRDFDEITLNKITSNMRKTLKQLS